MMPLDYSCDLTSEILGRLSVSDEQLKRKRARQARAMIVDVQAIREALGMRDWQTVLSNAQLELAPDVLSGCYFVLSYQAYARLYTAIRELYGHASHGILNRIGRIAFRHFVETQSEHMAAISIALRLMPLQARKIFILRVVARTLSENNAYQPARLDEDNGQLTLVDPESPACNGVVSDHPICWHTVGFLEEALRWATAQEFRVEEISCRAQGGVVCTFAIAREPNTPLSLA
jgi:predicted hydrocarbon binding protein